MKKYIKLIQGLSEKLIVQWYDEGVSPQESQDTLLVVIREYLDPQNPNIQDMKECVQGLKMLLK